MLATDTEVELAAGYLKLRAQNERLVDTVLDLTELLQEAVVLAKKGTLPDADAIACWRAAIGLPEEEYKGEDGNLD